jgi:hypothetical protein
VTSARTSSRSASSRRRSSGFGIACTGPGRPEPQPTGPGPRLELRQSDRRSARRRGRGLERAGTGGRHSPSSCRIATPTVEDREPAGPTPRVSERSRRTGSRATNRRRPRGAGNRCERGLERAHGAGGLWVAQCRPEMICREALASDQHFAPC